MCRRLRDVGDGNRHGPEMQTRNTGKVRADAADQLRSYGRQVGGRWRSWWKRAFAQKRRPIRVSSQLLRSRPDRASSQKRTKKKNRREPRPYGLAGRKTDSSRSLARTGGPPPGFRARLSQRACVKHFDGSEAAKTLGAGLGSASLLLRQSGHHILQRSLHAMLFAVQCAYDGQIRSPFLRHSVRVNPSDGFGTNEFRNAFFSGFELLKSHSASIRAPTASGQAKRQFTCSAASV